MKKLKSIYRFFKIQLKKKKPTQLLILGFLSYILFGTIFLLLPYSRKSELKFIDDLFTIVSAVSTTGLTTVSIADSYSLFGQLVIMSMFQMGGIGYMAISSFIILSRGKQISLTRQNILTSEYALPKGFNISDFVYRSFVFTIIIESIGALLLFLEFNKSQVSDPLWSSIFHSISAFATAGFSLNNNSLEDFKINPIVNIIIASLCYLGAIGFIVIEDVWLALKNKEYKITFTSKIILLVTFSILVIELVLFSIIESSIQNFSLLEKIQISSFQIMTASTTAGFNTIPIGSLQPSSLVLIIIAMVIGASPSGTGGGIKTTSFTALIAVSMSILRGQTYISFFKNRIPLIRLFTAVASVSIYLFTLFIGVFLLSIFENQDFIKIVFEAASALGTVGLSMGITGNLTFIGKIIIIALMFFGRVGPLTIGLALMNSPKEYNPIKDSDLAL